MTELARRKAPLEQFEKYFRKIMLNYKGIFRVHPGVDPLADVAPMEIMLESTERPFKVPQRTRSPEQQDFMKNKCDGLHIPKSFVKMD